MYIKIVVSTNKYYMLALQKLTTDRIELVVEQSTFDHFQQSVWPHYGQYLLLRIQKITFCSQKLNYIRPTFWLQDGRCCKCVSTDCMHSIKIRSKSTANLFLMRCSVQRLLWGVFEKRNGFTRLDQRHSQTCQPPQVLFWHRQDMLGPSKHSQISTRHTSLA